MKNNVLLLNFTSMSYLFSYKVKEKSFNRKAATSRRSVKIADLYSPNRQERDPNFHLEKKLFVCDSCDYKTTIKYQIRNHMDSAHTHEKSVCIFCNKFYRNKLKLKYHIASVHMNGDLFACLICNKRSFKMYEDFHKHIDNYHSEEKTKTTYTCDICDTRLYSKIQLGKHMLRSHCGRYKCFDKKCLRNFTSIQGREKHHLSFHNPNHEVRNS